MAIYLGVALYEGQILLLYDSLGEQRYRVMRSFFEAGVEKNNLCVYGYPRKKVRIAIKDIPAESLRELKLIRGPVKMLKEEDLESFYSDFANLKDYAAEEGYEGVHLLTDFGRVREDIMEEVLRLERRLHASGGKLPVSSISSYDTNFISQGAADSLIAHHDRAMMTTGEGLTSIAFFRRNKGRRFPEIGVVSSKMMEESVKRSLREIILSQLKQRPMCGFDIIKTLMHNFDVHLSQGTVYPILYSLEQEGYLRVDPQPDNKTKLYIPTEKGEEYIERQISEYLRCQSRLLSLIGRDE